MTYTKKQVLPALHKSNKLKSPDMPDVEDRNYTATILKYGNLAVPFPQLDTNAKTIVAAINELYAHPGGSVVIPNPPIDVGLQTESGDTIQTESGESIETEQGGGGTVVGPLNSISIDGDIYTIGGGSNVVANPDELAVSPLYKIKIDDGIYYIDSGMHSITKVLSSSSWNTTTLRQDVTVSGIRDISLVWVAPYVDSETSVHYDNYVKYGIKAIANSFNRVTFSCDSIPDTNIWVSISYCTPSVS